LSIDRLIYGKYLAGGRSSSTNQ